ncbi:MAG: hypothetical protein JNM82_11945 [Rhodocyclaceae bacterium]|nr:hypothetical protein [Rhodocyclaceae bacterium]
MSRTSSLHAKKPPSGPGFHDPATDGARRPSWHPLILAVLPAAILGPGTCLGEEFAPFRITGVEAYASMRFTRDDFSARQPGSPSSRQAWTDFRQELFLLTHSYVYHPNFLSLDVGGGPILDAATTSTESAGQKGRSLLYNLTARASFLRDKPYRGAIFFDHLNPTVALSPGQILTQENTRYGIDLALLPPATNTPLNLDAQRSETTGSGTDMVVRDRSERLNFRASRAFGEAGTTEFRYQSGRQDSASGNPRFAILPTRSSSEGMGFDTRLRFGDGRRYEITHLINQDSQRFDLGAGGIPDRRDLRMITDLRARHSDALQTYLTHNRSESIQGANSATLNSLAGGMAWRADEHLATAASLRTDDNRTTQFLLRSRTADGSLQYQAPLAGGTGTAGASWRLENRDQQAFAAQATVFGERATLTGLATFGLGQPRVVGGTVLVSNLARTQIYVEGIDYALSLVGLQTRIQRLVGGSILDGQEVLLDYAYDVGGTYGVRQADRSLSLGWNYRSFLSVWYRHLDVRPTLTSGLPTSPLNAVKASLLGARFDLPLNLTVATTIGGGLETEDRRETIASYTRTSADCYAQMDDPFFSHAGQWQLGARRVRMHYRTAAQDMNITGMDLRYRGILPPGIEVSGDIGYERDNGALLPLSRLTGTLRAHWRYRKLLVNADLVMTRETQGPAERKRSLVQVQARRDF